MASYVFFAAFACTTTLFAFGPVDSHPQQFFQQQQQQQQSAKFTPVSEVCLGCICESVSSCNRDRKCEGDVCGMFGITWAYWADSGKPVLQGDNPNDGQAYARCANDPSCARQSVVNYLTRFAQDCNLDGSIDCLDYASIHMLGGYGCNGHLNDEYKNKYNACQKAVYDLSGGSAAPPQTPQQPANGDSIDIRLGNN